jgi:hypothetical protein
MKLIDAEALKTEILKAPVWTGLDAIAKINTMPTIEAVPKEFHDKTCEAMAKRHQEEIADMVSVVRCKECRYCKRKKGTFKGEPIIFYRCEENNRDVDSDDFCSYGERREP